MGCARNVDHRPSVCTFSIAYLCNSCQVHSICSKLHFFKDLPLNIQQELQYVCCKIDTQSFDRSIVLHILHCVGFHSHIYVYIYICYIYIHEFIMYLHVCIWFKCYLRVFKKMWPSALFCEASMGSTWAPQRQGDLGRFFFLLWNMAWWGDMLLMMEEILHKNQLRLVVFFCIIYSVGFYTSQVVVRDFSHQQYPCEFPTFWVLFGLKVTKSIEYIPSWEPIYLILRHFWRLFSFSHDMLVSWRVVLVQFMN